MTGIRKNAPWGSLVALPPTATVGNDQSNPRSSNFVEIQATQPVSDPSKLAVSDALAMKTVETMRKELSSLYPLAGKTFAVVTESLFIPSEQKAYATLIRQLGGKVEFVSRLWNQPKLTFTSDTNAAGDWQNTTPRLAFDVTKDISEVTQHISEYDGVIFSANYTTKRLNYSETMKDAKNTEEIVESLREVPLARLVRAVMDSPRTMAAFNCHAVWALQTYPEKARGVKMAVNPVVAQEALNAGVEIVPNPPGHDFSVHTVVDGKVVSSASGVGGGTEALVRALAYRVLGKTPPPIDWKQLKQTS